MMVTHRVCWSKTAEENFVIRLISTAKHLEKSGEKNFCQAKSL